MIQLVKNNSDWNKLLEMIRNRAPGFSFTFKPEKPEQLPCFVSYNMIPGDLGKFSVVLHCFTKFHARELLSIKNK